MNKDEACRIIGNQPAYAVRNMIRALESIPFLNTDEDNRRLEAARIWIKLKPAERSRGRGNG